ncbi:hypothetical protein ACHAP8_008200 [Fusarium lateritium]
MSSSSELSDIDSTMLSPSRSPTPSVSRSVSEDPLRRSASEPCIGPITPATSQQSLELVETKASDSKEESIDNAIDQVPFSLARMVVNMQEYYMSELQAERQKTDRLTLQNEEMMQRMKEMDKRLQMHVVLMDGFVGFMREVKQGHFASAEIQIANQFGGVHLNEVKGLCAPVQQIVEQPTPPGRSDEQRIEEPTPCGSNIFDQLPPTPDMETPPVRSTGRRAPKRKNPPTRPHREVKRRTRADVRSVRLRHSSWKAINTVQDTGRDEESGDEYQGDANDQDYAPEPEDPDEDESEEEHQEPEPIKSLPKPTKSCTETPVSYSMEAYFRDTNYLSYGIHTPPTIVPEPKVPDKDESEDEHQEPEPTKRTSNSPTPSEDEDPEAEKPRYNVSRSIAPRFAAGPSGPRFKYFRMPKTVALVWQEWKHGSHGNPAIEELENKYNTSWRMGTLQERKYASNYIGVRQKVVRKVEEMCEEGMTAKEACEVLDKRVDGRMQLLMTALRKGEDPLVVIPRRR